MKLIYSGGHPVVDVIEDGDVVLENVPQGEPTEVPDAIARRLLTQDSWNEPEQAQAPAKPTQEKK